VTSQGYRKSFWDEKIVEWEERKYDVARGLIDVNRSVRFRMDVARRILRMVVKGRTVLELGCGSSRLLAEVGRMGARKYIGVDVASTAIAAAERAARQFGGLECELINGDVTEVRRDDADICFSLGLLDWLSLDEIKRVRANIPTIYFFHSYSEKRLSLQYMAHKAYVFAMYGHRSKGYVPHYYSEEDIEGALRGTLAPGRIQSFRSPRLSFGAIAHHLPAGLEAELEFGE